MEKDIAQDVLKEMIKHEDIAQALLANDFNKLYAALLTCSTRCEYYLEEYIEALIVAGIQLPNAYTNGYIPQDYSSTKSLPHIEHVCALRMPVSGGVSSLRFKDLNNTKPFGVQGTEGYKVYVDLTDPHISNLRGKYIIEPAVRSILFDTGLTLCDVKLYIY